MAVAPKSLDDARVDRIFLLLSNPRHVPFATEGQAIAYLCDKENVLPLARDIVRHGLNPLERFALIPIDKRNPASGYNVAEGNRRFCALKLLNDPDLAPTKLRKAFEKLSEEWTTPIKRVPAVVFDSIDTVKLWLDRIHGGLQGGIGRKEWNSEQKTRAHGGNKNKPSQALLDYAEAKGMISAEERSGKLTTVQRFLSNDVFREVIGFDQADPEEVARRRPEAEFDILIRRFIRDLVAKKDVNSRMNKREIIEYSRPLGSMNGITSTRIEPESLTAGAGTTKSKRGKSKPKKPERAKHVQYEQEIFDALKGLRNGKLESLYHSICSVDLDPHTPLIAVGTWSFFETLTACAGRAEGTSFDSFLSKQRLRGYGFAGETTSLTSALARVREYGNTTKHHPVSATFNGDQLNNDMIALKILILKCIGHGAEQMASGVSPLRYPGGKTCLFDLASSILRINRLERGHYIEPYAGGCGLALELLFGGHVADIHINDIDPAIWAFWYCVLNETDALIDKIASTPVTIPEWLKQRDQYRKQEIEDTLALGFSAFFLNRTNRSGIIKGAGVIGGLAQNGNYKVDCRYNKPDLMRRVNRIRKYRDRIHLTQLDALEFILNCKKNLPQGSFMFIDPPYYKKGAELYTSFYKKEDHVALSKQVLKLVNPWIMTYDDDDNVRTLYKRNRQFCFDINYSLQQKRTGVELLIASKGVRLPAMTKERQVYRPQHRAA